MSFKDCSAFSRDGHSLSRAELSFAMLVEGGMGIHVKLF